MKPFLDLLSWRALDAVSGSAGRRWRVARRRSSVEGVPGPCSDQDRRRCFIDVAVIAGHDAGTGIQRVVRAVALAMLASERSGWDLRFVAANRRHRYHEIGWPEDQSPPGSKAEMRARPGDIFLGLDFSLDALRRHRKQLQAFRSAGGKLWFLIYDLLPIDRPEWFSPKNALRFRIWLEMLAGMADGFFCISEQTETDLRRVMSSRFGLTSGFATRVITMGHCLAESQLRCRTDPGLRGVARFDVNVPFALMVGTLEPRKGHVDILSAYTRLWAAGSNQRLVLVGRQGWKTDALRDQILSHPEYGRNLLWFDDADDEELDAIYRSSCGVIVGSLAEGFGLPLIEGLGYGKPVLARDLPIFRMHEGCGVTYFPCDASPTALAQCIEEWLGNIAAGRIAVSAPNKSWAQAAQQIFDTIDSDRCTKHVGHQLVAN